jgi:peroxiredoxin
MRRLTLALAIAILASAAAIAQTVVQDTKQRADGEARPKPDVLLRQMADYIGALPAFSCRVETSIHISAKGMNNRQQKKWNVKLQRPNRLSLVVDEGLSAITLISDGKNVFQYKPVLSQYTVVEAPADLAGFAASTAASGLREMAVPESLVPTSGDNLYKNLMESVTSSEYLGIEKLNDVACHHCRFLQKDINWEIWIEAGERPVVHKVVPDLSMQVAGLEDAKVEFVVSFLDWNVAAKFTDADFRFAPPAGAEKVDSFSRGAIGPGAIHPLLGKASPPFETVDLDGKPIDLASHLGKSVVMLDFWATWCGPCIAAMPEVSGVAKKFADRGLVFYAVNVAEDVDTIKEFLKAKEFDVPVAMDPKSEISQLYGVTGIPQTVLIGKDGKVQVVHVGFGGDLANELTKQVEDLLAGKDLATATLAAAEKAKQQKAALTTVGLKAAWTLPGQWNGVVADGPSKTVYATDSLKGAVAIDADGTIQRAIQIGQAGWVRLANLVGDAAPELITYRTWGASVKAFSSTGEALWEYPGGAGVDDVWAADVNGDGRDEVIIGYNGSTGLHVVDAGGKPLWKFADIGNVWHVTAGDFMGDRETEVVTTSAQGAVHVFSADGRKLKDIDVGFYANVVRMATLGDGSHPAVVTGSANGGEVMVCLNAEGEKKWSLALPGGDSNHVDDVAVATKPWAAVAMRGGLIHVVDLESGQIVAHVEEQGQRTQVAWLPREGQSPLLLVATGKDLNAFEVTADEGEATETRPTANLLK